jgi:hypothetical protein
MSILDSIRNRFAPILPMPQGMFQMQAAPQDAPPYRLHLRMHPDGSGILIVNASTVLHLNPTATEYAYHFIKGSNDEDAAKAVAKRYRVSKKQALGDFRDLVDRVQSVINTPDLDPVSMLDFERVRPYDTILTAPLRLDCALTYRLREGATPVDAVTKRVSRELTTEEWYAVLDKAWAFGIPHVTFTGGEPTLRDDLPSLIAHAESNGQVSGLLTDGLKLADANYLNVLLQTGLDHLLFLLEPDNPDSWQALDNCLKADIFVTVHITIMDSDPTKTKALLDKLAEKGVINLSMSTDPAHWEAALIHRRYFAELGMRMVWDLPVPYGENNPVALELVEDETSPSGAGKVWLYVEPDGDVLPAQGRADEILGNVLMDDWKVIYK